ncbi:4-alpha-glucanotransferase [Oceanivirga miroungae]|uniref:4-alpha-glucanotransferase n=1 Tax=Oceanivirga miroungae TaxID=1130046 RepID=A0A6I8M6J8_9FUSO|nr:4-alpha-glucanotransferase [Oceanivirga miroungae]VWL85076.1 4-alpha-glucanotransferase [Oceanivirga miroungae]
MIKKAKQEDEFEKEAKSLFEKLKDKVDFSFKEEKSKKIDELLEKMNNKKERKAGILMHPTSLQGNNIVGTLGKHAYEFIDFLEKANQSLWQIYPLGPTGYNDSPYQCFSAFAGNPYLIDLEELVNEGIITNEDKDEVVSDNNLLVDYGKLYFVKNRILEKAYENHHILEEEFNEFKKENDYWLDDYSLFMALKKHFNGNSWINWDEDIKYREKAVIEKYKTLLAKDIEVQKFMQFLFFRQWIKVKAYANSKGIEIIGDIPIFVSSDSSDAWANTNLFVFESVAGVPPDYFSATGQLWGNPLYDWEEMKYDKYAWWKLRFKANLTLYDIIRLDHFRGFESYWAIPKDEETAINGKWKKGPAKEFFDEIFKEFPHINLIAEDLGTLTNEVVELKNELNLPGMNILQFAFSKDPKNVYLPHNYVKNSVVYTGTHDNDTTLGWYQKLSDEEKGEVRDYLDVNDDNICWHLIRLAHRSISDMCIIPMQDYIEYGSDARMNTPSVASGNWQWRIGENVLTDELANRISHITKIYGR